MPFLLTLGESLWSQKNASIEMEIYFIEETINFIKKKPVFQTPTEYCSAEQFALRPILSIL